MEKSFEHNGGQLYFSIFNFSFYIRQRERGGGAEWRKVGRETAQSDRIKRSNEHRVVNYLAGDGKGQRWDGQRRGKGKKRDTGGATKDYIRDTGQRPSSFATSNQT